MSTLASGSSSYGYDPFEPAPKSPRLALVITLLIAVLLVYLTVTA